MNRLFIFLILIFPNILCAQSYSKVLGDWKSNPLPKSQDYKDDVVSWTVYLDEGIPKVTHEKIEVRLPKGIDLKKSKEYSSPVRRMIGGEYIDYQAVDNGYLISVDRGEFGGELYWFSKRGRKNYEVSSANFNQFVLWNDQLFALDDQMRDGSIELISKKDHRWTKETFLKLPHAPQAACLDKNGNLLVVTTDNILQIDKNKQIKILTGLDLWDGHSRSTSMIRYNDELYIGMLFGVFKYSLETGKCEWLTPN